MNHGKIIVIEGLAGSGKQTQSEILFDKFCDLRKKAELISMPNYQSLSSGPVRMYLNSQISENLFDVNSFAASSFFAVDRFINYVTSWKKFYFDENYTIICDRYTTSNMIYQLAKLDFKHWDNFLDWLCDYEYNKLQIPKPDTVIYLKLPIEISQKLLQLRNEPIDLHESDIKFLKLCLKAAEYSAEKFGWHTINCSEDGERVDPLHKISEQIFKILNI